jgi:capsular polysaccharide biosynthesis protein
MPLGPSYFLLCNQIDNIWHYFYNFLLRTEVVRLQFGSLAASPYTFLLPSTLKTDFYQFARLLGIAGERCCLFDPKQPMQLPNLTITPTPFCLSSGKVYGSKAACSGLPNFSDGNIGWDRIYLSRNDARWRRVLNEDEFLPQLESRGFKKIRLCDFSVEELSKLMSGAKYVIAPSGANLAATFFCTNGCKIIEFSDKPMILKYYFQIASSAHGFHHYKLKVNSLKKDDNYHRWDMTVSVSDLLKLVDALI